MGEIRTLVVDDSACVREAMVSLVLSIRGCSVVGEAANGLEALALARVLYPNLVIMDLHMPVMDGLEATYLLKEELPCTQVVVVSSALEPPVRDAALRCGAIACLEKGAALWDGIVAIASRLSQASQDGPADS